MMFEKLLAQREHVPPHRLWAYFNAEVEMTVYERIHILHCDDCQEIFLACVHAETFGAALKRPDSKKSA
jgi:hypothetical protein